MQRGEPLDVRLSKFLSYVCRHGAEREGIQVQEGQGAFHDAKDGNRAVAPVALVACLQEPGCNGKGRETPTVPHPGYCLYLLACMHYLHEAMLPVYLQEGM